MKNLRFLLPLALLFCVGTASYSQIFINEGSNKNYSSISDENGDFPDWIEVYNAGGTAIQLLDYALSDDPTNPTKWTFPNIELQPGEFKVIFCSGKDRKPITGFVGVLNELNYNPVVGWNNHILTTPFYWDGSSSLRFAAWRSGGFLAQKSNRRTALEPTTKLSYEALNPPLRQTAVRCWRSCSNSLVVIIFRFFFCCLLCITFDNCQQKSFRLRAKA